MTPVIYGLSGPSLTKEEAIFFQEQNPVGFILFSKNIVDPDQVRALVQSLREAIDNPNPLILIDQEGGRVARLKPPHWRKAPKTGVFAQLANQNIEQAKEAVYHNYRVIAEDLYQLGINVDCAPMIDLLFEGAHEIVGDRAFGSDPEIVVTLAREASRGLLDGGVLPIMKHIPGHGRAQVDSHEALPTVDTPLASLESSDFIPFKAMANEVPMAMTAHIQFNAIDSHSPVTFSRDAITLIREKIGFDGMLLTDDLSMKALQGSFADRTRASLDAGCDIILHCNGEMEEMQAIASVKPHMSEAIETRLDACLEYLSSPKTFDRKVALEKLEALIGCS